jgi:hypothetical protein
MRRELVLKLHFWDMSHVASPAEEDFILAAMQRDCADLWVFLLDDLQGGDLELDRLLVLLNGVRLVDASGGL